MGRSWLNMLAHRRLRSCWMETSVQLSCKTTVAFQVCVPLFLFTESKGGANPKELSESLEVIENFFVQHLLKNPQHPVPALYSTWGHRDGVITSYASRFPVEAYPDYLTMQRKITAGYETYAELLRKYFPKVLVIPVGDAFEIVYHDSQSPDFKFPNLFWRLYDNVDTFHPSKIGTYLAACCFWGVYSGNSPQQLKWIPDAESTKEWDEKIFKQHGDKIQIQEVTEEVAEYLRDVAYKAVSQSKSKI